MIKKIIDWFKSLFHKVPDEILELKEIIAQVEKEKKVARREAMANPKVATEMVRARNDQGHYIADDPSTPENEAWVEKPKKKAAPKKKAPAKKKTAKKS